MSLYCTDCIRTTLDEVGYDIWGDGEEKQFICSCDKGKRIRGIVYLYDDEGFRILHDGIFNTDKRAEYPMEIE